MTIHNLLCDGNNNDYWAHVGQMTENLINVMDTSQWN